ncbi:hypothetical protein CAAN1_06S01200 [[Candida] anglica]|uniref:MARVEL domain-containing protein n=1 Tax=[Candida] anglica TaxID=148631 RepID=A0ABP0ELK1_9ASCO
MAGDQLVLPLYFENLSSASGGVEGNEVNEKVAETQRLEAPRVTITIGCWKCLKIVWRHLCLSIFWPWTSFDTTITLCFTTCIIVPPMMFFLNAFLMRFPLLANIFYLVASGGFLIVCTGVWIKTGFCISNLITRDGFGRTGRNEFEEVQTRFGNIGGDFYFQLSFFASASIYFWNTILISYVYG